MRSWSTMTAAVALLVCVAVLQSSLALGQELSAPDVGSVFTESQLLRLVEGVPQHTVPVDREWPRGTFVPLAKGTAPTINSKFTPPCDLTAGSGICLFGGKKTLTPPAVAAGTVGLYSFSEVGTGYIVDQSGSGNHALVMRQALAPKTNPADPKPALGPGEVRVGANIGTFDPSAHISVGPDRLGGAGSLLLTESTFLLIKNSASITTLTKEFSVSFWLFFADESVRATMGGCPLFAIGGNALSVLPGHQLTVAMKNKPIITSRAYLRPGQWNHIAFEYSSKAPSSFSLYINGVRDVHFPTDMESPLKPRVLIGAYAQSQCSYARFYIDDLRISSKPSRTVGVLPSTSVPATAFPALGAVEPTFAQIGCSRTKPCNWEGARRACNRGYHLCSETELRAGAYNVARTLGWITWDDNLWTSDGDGLDIKNMDPEEAKKAPPENRVALCCAFY